MWNDACCHLCSRAHSCTYTRLPTHTGWWDIISPIHTARWSRKIARKLPECLLCERKHVPGLIPGLIPGWDLVTLPGSVPERALCEQKPDQCRKGCVVVMTHFNRSTVLTGCFEGRSTFTRRKMCKLEWSSDQGAPHYPRWSWNHSPV